MRVFFGREPALPHGAGLTDAASLTDHGPVAKERPSDVDRIEPPHVLARVVSFEIADPHVVSSASTLA
jgi:hypothetical protein